MWWFFCILVLYKSSFIHSQSLPLLLFVSFDGFRFDYPKIHGPLGNFSRLEQGGVRAHSMMPTFNTATYPNHYTLMTGVYEEVHGLISDEIYDPTTKSIFQSWKNMTSQWWPLKSIWTINEQRSGARSGVIGWTQDLTGISKSEIYRKERTYQEIIDQILRWFNDPNEPINFGAIYFQEPGLTGRQTGPYSNTTKKIVQQCDEYLGYLLNEINHNTKLKNSLHLIVTSNHGMEEINPTDKPMYLEDYVDMNKINAFGTETVLNIFVKSCKFIRSKKRNRDFCLNFVADDMNYILGKFKQIPHSKTYKKEEIPDRYHYKNNPRIGDLIVILERGYELHRRSFHGGTEVDLNRPHGNHGYDNQIESMKTIFYASGPQLKENLTLSNTSSLNNVDIFALMCLILNIDKCPPSNGSLANIQSFLMDPHRVISIIEKETEKLQDGPMGLVIYLLVLVSFVLILIMSVVWSAVSFRNASAMARITRLDPTTLAEQNQYKFTQINDRILNPVIGDDNL